MKKIIFFFIMSFLFFISCEEKECIVSTQPRDTSNTDAKFGTYGDHSYFLYGNCDDDGNFIDSTIDVFLAYKEKMNVNGIACNLVYLEDPSSGNKIPFFIARTNKWIKIFSHSFVPFVASGIMEEYAPHFWQTIWTRDYSNSTFDTMTTGVYPLLTLITKDTMNFWADVFVKCQYRFEYKYENLGEAFFNFPYMNSPILAIGTKITFNTTVKLTDDKYKFIRLDEIDTTFKNLPYDEFYFDNNRSSFVDKVVMKVYCAEPFGILWIWVKHKTLLNQRTYLYQFKYNLRISFGG
ncbi:MAG: hypothetical protein ACK42Z_01105 [Candidatus Kapaibacteriota bacterium]